MCRYTAAMRRTLARWGLLAFWYVLAVSVAVEIGVRILLFGSQAFSFERVNSEQGIGVSGMIRNSRHREIIYELTPNSNTYFKLERFTTNSQGLRDQDYPLVKPPGTRRVVVLGDSFTMPEGITLEDAWHSRLERRLSRESTELEYEFLNFGVGGYDPRQYLATLRWRAIDYDPDLILMASPGPFEAFKPEPKYSREFRAKPRGNPFFESFTLKLLTIKGRKAAKRLERAPLDARRRDLEAVYRELEDVSREIDVPVLIVVLSRYILERNPDHEMEIAQLRSMAAAHGFFFMETLPAFEHEDPDDLIRHRLDHHPNARANRIFAEAIYDFLKQTDLLLRASDLSANRIGARAREGS